jgi:hypothetical protein
MALRDVLRCAHEVSRRDLDLITPDHGRTIVCKFRSWSQQQNHDHDEIAVDTPFVDDQTDLNIPRYVN